MNLNEITLIIKTFERPNCLNRLLESIRWFYPDIKIIIADDSKNIKPILKRNIHHILFPFNSGASYCRNQALKTSINKQFACGIENPYVVCLDDDFIFTEKTKLETWIEILENSNINLISGNVGNTRYEACFKIEDNILKFIKNNKGYECNLPLYDITLQFWCARAKKIKEFGGWDNDFKSVDHLPFFLRAYEKIKISHCNEVSINHYQEKSPYYNNFRYGKVKDYYNLIAKKYGFNTIIGYNGEILYDNI